jgi:hypothetical protein
MLRKKKLAFDTSLSISIMDAETEAAAWAAIRKNACAARRLNDLRIMKMFTSKGLPEVWYPLCGGSFDCVSITQKTNRKKLGECKQCDYSERRIWGRLFGLELSGEPVYGDVADMLINRNNPSFWKRTILSCEDKFLMDWRTKNIVRGAQAGEMLRSMQPAMLWAPESSARTVCAGGPVKELIENTLLDMMRTAQATITGSAVVSVPAAPIDMFVKVGMTTEVVSRFTDSGDSISTRAIAKFLDYDGALPQRHRKYITKDLDEMFNGDGLTLVTMSVVLGLFRSDVPRAEERAANGLERCVYEVVAETMRTPTAKKITSGKVAVHLDASGRTCDVGLCYIGPSEADPRTACINTMTKDILAAGANVERHHAAANLIISEADRAAAQISWTNAKRAMTT